jgi:L,D-transpeptidase catalytic domain
MVAASAALVLLLTASVPAQTTRLRMSSDNVSDWHESERSDKFTGGRIESGELVAGDPDIWITVNVPSFRLTLWQSGREVKSYFVGVGQKDFPIVIGERRATEVIWNPAWIPPDSAWVKDHKGVRPGEVIKASDPRNPLGKLKIPLGGGYLIHQAKGVGDLGNLVSHGCVRMLRADLYDLAEKIVAARSLPVTRRQIEAAKRTSRTLHAALDPPVPVDINYDTAVVEGNVLHLYPDVYAARRNATVERLRAELQSSGVDASVLDDETLREMLSRVTRRTRFAVEVRSIEEGRALADGRELPLVGQPRARKAVVRKQKAAGRARGV